MTAEDEIAHRIVGTVMGLAIRSVKGGPMRTIPEVEAVGGGGIQGDVESPPHRGVTLLSSRQWAAVGAELGTSLPWHTRRANVLLDSDGLLPLIGGKIRVGEVIIDVLGETRPCALMDRLHPGLRCALEPDGRGGVHGRVLTGGRIRVGDGVIRLDRE